MTQQLPPRANFHWLRKTAKQNLAALKAERPEATLADAQLALARNYGFSSWRALKAHVEAQPPEQPSVEAVAAAFLRLVGDGETERVRAALAAAGPGLANIVGPHPYWGGRPQPLHVAVETKRRDMFDLLLAAGADPSGRNDEYDHWSPIMLTVSRDQPAMRADLIARGARIGPFEALLTGDDERVAVLLADGLLPASPNGGSALAFARTTFAIDRLLELGASATESDRWGVTPLEAMSRLGLAGSELVRHMMIRGLTPAPEAFARLGDREALATLVAADPAIARSDAVMLSAVESRNVDLVRWLLAQGGNANARRIDKSRQSALHEAAWNGDLDMVKLLVEAGADRHFRDGEHDAPPWSWAGTAVTITNNPACADVAAWLLAQES
jgi:ankyrin repeat protein